MRSWSYAALAMLALAALLVAAATMSRSANDYRLPNSAEPAVDSAPTSQPLLQIPPPPVEKSPFVNTSSAATYVGSEACASCHESEFESYLATTHSQALDDIRLDQEPPDGRFEHAVSGRNYTVYREDGQLRHRESIATAGGEHVLSDYPMRYVIGSGNHSRSYLVDIRGFLVESPLTWYTARKAWEMSPGYENNPLQQGFARPARFLCVNCHAGQVSTVGGSIQMLQIHEQAIGCERCHGPGSLHVQRHSQTALPTGEDNTIVHPGRLDRARREAICSQCHLATEAHSHVRGRTVADFRPGLRLTDFVVHYQLETPNQEMSVVGHVEQLHLSKCYQQSDMDCTTCHNPHVHTSPEQSRAEYRRKCLQCHQVDACGVELAQRRRETPSDDCVQCHMPRGPTEIPHFAFTHHRIGIHRPDEEGSEPELGELVAINSIDQLPQLDRDRCAALAYLAFAKSDPPHAQIYHQRGLDTLFRLRAQGLRDPEVEVALAWGYWRKDQRRSIDHARVALACEPLAPMTRRDALSVLARAYFDTRQDEQAVATLQRLADLQLDAEDSALLGQSLVHLGRFDQALEAVMRAVQIEPDRPDLREFLARLQQRRGETEKARQSRELAQQLQALRTRVRQQKPADSAGMSP